MKHAHTAGPWEAASETPGRGWAIFAPDASEYAALGDLKMLADFLTEEDATLLALAPTAPHDCDVPGCPGAENKRKLAGAANLQQERDIALGDKEVAARHYQQMLDQRCDELEDLRVELRASKRKLEAAGELLEAARWALEDLLRVQSFLSDVATSTGNEDLPTVTHLRKAIAKAQDAKVGK